MSFNPAKVTKSSLLGRGVFERYSTSKICATVLVLAMKLHECTDRYLILPKQSAAAIQNIPTIIFSRDQYPRISRARFMQIFLSEWLDKQSFEW